MDWTLADSSSQTSRWYCCNALASHDFYTKVSDTLLHLPISSLPWWPYDMHRHSSIQIYNVESVNYKFQPCLIGQISHKLLQHQHDHALTLCCRYASLVDICPNPSLILWWSHERTGGQIAHFEEAVSKKQDVQILWSCGIMMLVEISSADPCLSRRTTDCCMIRRHWQCVIGRRYISSFTDTSILKWWTLFTLFEPSSRTWAWTYYTENSDLMR